MHEYDDSQFSYNEFAKLYLRIQMTFKFKFDKKCAILQICKCNNYSEVHLLIASDGSIITENSIVKKEIPWRKKIYNFLRQTMR